MKKKSLSESLLLLSPERVNTIFSDSSAFSSLLSDLKLPSDFSKDQFIELLLDEAAYFFNNEKRKEGLKLLKLVKPLLSHVSVKNRALFYLTLANSFLLSNDYEGAEKAIKRAQVFIDRVDDPALKIKKFNLQFVIARTLKRPDAIHFLERSRELSLKHNFYENLVFCEVNLGLIAFFNKDHRTAFKHLEEVLNIISSHPYPREKLVMPCDFFLQVLSDNKGYVRVPRYRSLILMGVDLVLDAIHALDSPYQGEKRLSLLVNTLKLSDDLLSDALKKINTKLDRFKKSSRALLYAGVASGLGEYKNYKLALQYFSKAIELSSALNDSDIRSLRKRHAFLLSSALGIKMHYDLMTSSNLSYLIKKIYISTSSPTLLGDSSPRILFRNAVSDSNAIFSVSDTFLKKTLFVSLKDFINVKRVLTSFTHDRIKDNLLEILDVIVINALSYSDELFSLLLVGSSVKEGLKVKKGKKSFDTYQILAHLVPSSYSLSHIEDFDVKFLYELLHAPQKFKQIEILVPSDKVEKGYKPIF